MKCKCKQTFKICQQKSNLHFISLVPELSRKFSQFLQKLSLDLKLKKI